MMRSLSMLICGALLASPAFAQSEQYVQAAPMPQPQSPPMQAPPLQPPPAVEPPADSYANEADDEEQGYDVTYDVSTQPDEYDDGYDPNAYQQFQSQLEPYGDWQDDPNYGQVWTPSQSAVGADFSPYATDGRFVMSDYGWTWVSDYDWGWAPFHYGRWMVLAGRGWSWIPGTVWGPAWVNWRWGNGYVGWAPMAARGVVIGPPRGIRGAWRFTLATQLGARNVSYVPARVVPNVWGRTTMVSNVRSVNLGGTTVRIAAGPPAHLVAAAVGHAVTPVALNVAAPHALPRANIVPRVGTPLQSRPWMQAPRNNLRAPATRSPSRTLGDGTALPPRASLPEYRAPIVSRTPVQTPYRGTISNPTYGRTPTTVYGSASPYLGSAQAYRSANYSTPVYRSAAAPVYRSAPYAAPVYRSAPSNSTTLYRGEAAYSAPTYSAPTYAAPVYRAAPTYAAPTYSAPAYSAPTYSAPAMHSAPGGGFHGGGGGHRH
jgi:hypothetical protein